MRIALSEDSLYYAQLYIFGCPVQFFLCYFYFSSNVIWASTFKKTADWIGLIVDFMVSTPFKNALISPARQKNGHTNFFFKDSVKFHNWCFFLLIIIEVVTIWTFLSLEADFADDQIISFTRYVVRLIWKKRYFPIRGQLFSICAWLKSYYHFYF